MKKQITTYFVALLALFIVTFTTFTTFAQSSSLYLRQSAPPTLERGMIVNTAQQAASFTAVVVPAPREFVKHDLITIIIIESASAKLESTLDTDKESGVDGSIGAFPHFNLNDLLNGRLRQSDSSDNKPAVQFAKWIPDN